MICTVNVVLDFLTVVEHGFYEKRPDGFAPIRPLAVLLLILCDACA